MAADAVCLIVPGLTGGGAIVKAVTKLDDVVDAAKTVENLVDAAKAADNLTDSSKALRTADNLDVAALCFVSGTLVLSENGDVPIENVEVGDFVWAWDEETNDFSLREVVDTYVSQTNDLIHIIVDDVEIITTPNHPFYASYYGWTKASDIVSGDNLETVDGEYVTVDFVWREILTDEVTVYNLNVEGYHTYFVSALGVLVHNKCNQAVPLPQDGIRVSTDEALDMADSFLGRGYSEMSPGRFVSADGSRQVRMTASDLAAVNNHAGSPHLNFETLVPNSLKPGKFRVSGNAHVFISN